MRSRNGVKQNTSENMRGEGIKGTNAALCTLALRGVKEVHVVYLTFENRTNKWKKKWSITTGIHTIQTSSST